MARPSASLMRSVRELGAKAPYLPDLLALSDEARARDPLVTLEGLPAGSGYIFRHYSLARQERMKLAKEAERAARRRGIFFLVAGDFGLATHLRADGMHLSEWQVKRGYAARALERFALVTCAAHSAEALARAARAGLDAALLSPVFLTQSHPGAKALGLLRFAALAEEAALPVYAMGGINEETVRRLCPTKAAGIAGISFTSG